MTDPELRQLVESNARIAQAILEAMAEARLESEEPAISSTPGCSGWMMRYSV